MMIDGVLNGSPASVKVPSRLESEDKKAEIPTSQSFIASGIPIPNSSYQHGEAIAQNTPEFHVSMFSSTYFHSMFHIQFTKFVQRGGQVVGNNPLGSTPTALPNYGCGSWGAVYPSHTIVPAGMTAPQGWIFQIEGFVHWKKDRFLVIISQSSVSQNIERLERRKMGISEG